MNLYADSDKGVVAAAAVMKWSPFAFDCVAVAILPLEANSHMQFWHWKQTSPND